MSDTQITNLVYQCAELLDQGKLEAAAELFCNARVRIDSQADYLDSKALLKLWKKEYLPKADGTPGTQHLVSNPIVHVDEKSETASCRSSFMVIRFGPGASLQVSVRGVYDDKFGIIDGAWCFIERECRVAGNSQPNVEADSEKDEGQTPTKEKILVAAQEVFSTLGYAEASIRKIAEFAGLSPTLLFRHFGTKAKLFEEALIAVMQNDDPPADKSQFGRHVANMLADPNQVNCPHAMTVLATGSEEAREIAIRVLKQYALDPAVEWLEGPNAESRAREMLALCAGFALYNSQLNGSVPKRADPHMIDWFAKGIQAIVDQS